MTTIENENTLRQCQFVIKKRFKELDWILKGKDFDEACSFLGGHNKTSDYFDLNYKEMCITIYKTPENGCELSKKTIEYWQPQGLIGCVDIE